MIYIKIMPLQKQHGRRAVNEATQTGTSVLRLEKTNNISECLYFLLFPIKYKKTETRPMFEESLFTLFIILFAFQMNSITTITMPRHDPIPRTRKTPPTFRIPISAEEEPESSGHLSGAFHHKSFIICSC